jgi:hypothetical protein
MSWPVVSFEYDPGLVPHLNDTLTLLAVPSQVRSPLRRAELVVILLGSTVLTDGDGGKVLKLFSSP